MARAMLTSLTVEHEMERLGVEVVYANEPVGGTKSGQLRSRRYGQVEAEVYRTVLNEMSMGGQIQHAINGWNHGYAPYPYITLIDENAPVRRRDASARIGRRGNSLRTPTHAGSTPRGSCAASGARSI